MSVRNGFLIVASRTEEYVRMANFCGGSIKDWCDGAHVTLFVPDNLKQYVDSSSFDLVISENVPDHTRTKLWALSRTPYTNLTVYVDADMECRHEDVNKIWDEIKEDQDILITRIRPYNGQEHKWSFGEMIYHGGFFMYRSTPKIISFMEKWWEGYVKQKSEPWPWTEAECPESFGRWDQFTFWKLLNIDKEDVNVGVFKDDARWNFVNGYRPYETKNPIIFYHHTLPSKRPEIGLTPL
jgi:hypothetical protein